MARILEPGEWQTRCSRCSTLFAYTYQDVDDWGAGDFGSRDETVTCPSCGAKVPHHQRLGL